MLHRKFDLFLGWHRLVLLLGLRSLVVYISYVDQINQRGSLSILFFNQGAIQGSHCRQWLLHEARG
jgi:hypothetical protein